MSNTVGITSQINQAPSIIFQAPGEKESPGNNIWGNHVQQHPRQESASDQRTVLHFSYLKSPPLSSGVRQKGRQVVCRWCECIKSTSQSKNSTNVVLLRWADFWIIFHTTPPTLGRPIREQNPHLFQTQETGRLLMDMKYHLTLAAKLPCVVLVVWLLNLKSGHSLASKLIFCCIGWFGVKVLKFTSGWVCSLLAQGVFRAQEFRSLIQEKS